MNRLNIIIALIVFGIIVLIHELGHFLVAKANGIMVEEFAIGMGPKIVGKKVGETLYSLRILPIGGFCKMLGEEEELQDERSFSSKSVPARIAVIAAGPFMNFLLAFIILFTFAFHYGYTVPVVDVIDPGFPAEEANLQTGDKILELNGNKIHIMKDLSYMLMENEEKPFTLTVKRGTEVFQTAIEPKWDETYQSWRIGFTTQAKHGNILEMIAHSFWEIIFLIKITVLGFVKLILGQVSRDQVAGPIGIVQIIGQSYEEGMKAGIGAAIANIANLMVMLSANLGALNLFPIPALDGSRIVFLIVEGIRRKPLKQEMENMIHVIGFGLLMLLMVFVAYNDIVKLFQG